MSLSCSWLTLKEIEVLYGNEGTKIVPPAAVGEVMSKVALGPSLHFYKSKPETVFDH